MIPIAFPAKAPYTHPSEWSAYLLFRGSFNTDFDLTTGDGDDFISS
jgi:hypothetical protein